MAQRSPSLNCSSVDAVYFLQEDYEASVRRGFPNRPDSLPLGLSTYVVCQCIELHTGCRGVVDGAQLLNGVWHIYPSSKKNRATLLELPDGVMIGYGEYAQLMKLQGELPEGNTPVVNPNKAIYIKGLPMHVNNKPIWSLFKHYDIHTSGDIAFVTELNYDGEFTEFKNGDRVVFTQGPIIFPLPRVTFIANYKCRIFHDGQEREFPPGEIFPRYDEPFGYNTEDNVTAFRGVESELSNFFPCSMSVFSENFISSEHAYQWYKARVTQQWGLARSIKEAPTARDAKVLSKNIDNRMCMERLDRRELMLYLVKVKAVQCPQFRTALLEAKKYIAEANRDFYWATGLMVSESQATLPQFWPGYNLLGRIHSEVRRWLKSVMDARGGDVTMNDVSPHFPPPPLPSLEGTSSGFPGTPTPHAAPQQATYSDDFPALGGDPNVKGVQGGVDVIGLHGDAAGGGERAAASGGADSVDWFEQGADQSVGQTGGEGPINHDRSNHGDGNRANVGQTGGEGPINHDRSNHGDGNRASVGGGRDDGNSGGGGGGSGGGGSGGGGSGGGSGGGGSGGRSGGGGSGRGDDNWRQVGNRYGGRDRRDRRDRRHGAGRRSGAGGGGGGGGGGQDGGGGWSRGSYQRPRQARPAAQDAVDFPPAGQTQQSPGGHVQGYRQDKGRGSKRRQMDQEPPPAPRGDNSATGHEGEAAFHGQSTARGQRPRPEPYVPPRHRDKKPSPDHL